VILSFLVLPVALVGGSSLTEVFSLSIPKDQIALRQALSKVKGVTGVGIDLEKRELTLRLEGVDEKAALHELKKRGLAPKKLFERSSKGGPDTLLLTPDGSAVGSLDTLRVRGKYTVFDVFADWCGPCTIVDVELTKILDERNDVAVRRLNLVSFESPLAEELQLEALPHMVVFSPSGQRTEIEGADLEELRDSLKAP
jgi:thiol-disulfide isomerase/thioredoxin